MKIIVYDKTREEAANTRELLEKETGEKFITTHDSQYITTQEE